MREKVKLIVINLVVLGFLLSLINFLAITGIKFFNWSKPKQYAQSHLLPNYRNVDWARQHFIEYDALTKGYYKSFYAWLRPEYHGQTINIDETGHRRTFAAPGDEPDKTIAFFGGSTTWGTGANDETTIPSYFAKENPSYRAINFGETGYVAHQGVNRFMERYFAGFRPDVVVFYDGVNDVWNKCRRGNGPFSHSREQQIRRVLQEWQETSYLSLIGPLMDVAGRVQRTLMVRGRQAEATIYDCDEDPAKAEQVARVLLYDWSIVKDLVESYGGRFIGILQPQAYDGTSKLDHLTLDPDLGRQYEAVYPMIVDMLTREFPDLAANFVDLRTALDVPDYFYIDWCHLSPNGNEIIARRISEALAQGVATATARDLGPSIP